MINLPIEIIFKIYTYGGANIFYLNKEGLKYIQNLRLEFLKNPILMYYTIKEYEKRIIFSNGLLSSNTWKVRIIGKNVSIIGNINNPLETRNIYINTKYRYKVLGEFVSGIHKGKVGFGNVKCPRTSMSRPPTPALH